MRWLRVVVSLALLGVTAFLLDIERIATTVRGANGWYVAAALVVSIPLLSLLAWRWKFTAERMGLELPFGIALREYYVSTLLNQILPGGVLGDVSRVFRVSAKTPAQRGAIARCVVIDRLSAQAALWLVLIAGVAVWGLRDRDPAAEIPAASVAMVLLGGIVAVLLAATLALRFGRLQRTRFGQAIARALEDVRSSMVHRRAWAWQLAGSLSSVALLTVMFGLSTASLGVPTDLVELFFVAPIILAVSSLPISVGGWGAREVTSAGLFELVGLSAVDGAAAGAIFGLVSLVCTLPGVAFIWAPSRSEAT